MYVRTFKYNESNRSLDTLDSIPYVQLVKLRKEAEKFLKDINKAIENKG